MNEAPEGEPPIVAPEVRPRRRYVRVAVNSGRPTSMTFTYHLPPGREARAGEVLHVPFGARTLQGVVVEGPVDLPGYAGETRPVDPPLQGAPVIAPERLVLARWIADRYLAPPWESHALMLPPGAGERPHTLVARASPTPSDGDGASSDAGGAPSVDELPERQARLYALLGEQPRDADELRAELGARGFEPALAGLVRRGLAERRYQLSRPRGRARVAEVVRLRVPPERARAAAAAIEGRRASRRARALRALLAAEGPLPAAELGRIARGAPAVETLVSDGLLEEAPPPVDGAPDTAPGAAPADAPAVLHEATAASPHDGGAVAERDAAPAEAPEATADPAEASSSGAPRALRLAISRERAELEVRLLSRTRAEQAAAELLERLAAAAEEGHEPVAPVAGLARELGSGARAAVERLEADGLVAVEEVLERRDPLAGLSTLRRPPPELIGEQRIAAARARAAIDRAQTGGGEGSALLVAGVTGSGKTEVYLDALQHAVEHGRRGIVLVPEIALTPQTVRRFAERFPGRVGVLHSGLSLGEAFDEWHAAAEGRYDVVIGSRSAIFAPVPDLGLVVIDEAHEWTYKQQDPAPRYDARDVARRLCELTGAALVLGTATPSAEQWYAAASGELERVDLPRRVRPVPQPGGGVTVWPSDDLPEVEVVDMRGSRSLFSEQLVLALGETLDRDEQAILFLNRRGLAGFLLCPRGHSPACPSCDVSLALHARGEAAAADPRAAGGAPTTGGAPGGGGRGSGLQLLVCHQCGRRRALPAACAQCGGTLRPARAGTQQVEREVRRLYTAARVARWDRDTARRREQHEAILGRFLRQEVDVLVGTQMVAKGLDLPAVTLVGVVLADYTLREGDFRSRERTVQLLVQVSGRAGRAERPGRVLIQTLQPEDRAVLAAAAGDVDGFLEQELPWRAAHDYPPFRRLARLLFAHPRPAYGAEEAARVAQELRALAAGQPNVEVLGPLRPRLGRLRGRHRWSLVVKADDPAELLRPLELPPGWSIDIDPVSVD